MRHGVLLLMLSGCQYLFRLDPVAGPDAAAQTADAAIDMPADAPGCSVFQARVDYPAMSLPASLVIFDVNGDGLPDVVLGSAGSRTVQAFKNTGASFVPEGAYGTTIQPVAMASGQLNNDSNRDLVIADDTAAIELMIAQGSFAFASGNMYATTSPSALAVGDYNGDGKDDVVTTDNANNQARGWVGQADGTLSSLDLGTTGASPARIVTTSIDGDSKADFAIADTGSPQFSIVRGNQFQVSNSQLHGIPADVAASDVNTDGAVDLIFTQPTSGQLETALGGSTTRLSPTPGHAPQLLTIADFDKDGMQDVVFYDDATPAIVEMRGNGDGTFGDTTGAGERVISLPARAVALGVADFDGDQRPDVALALAGVTPRLAIFSACP